MNFANSIMDILVRQGIFNENEAKNIKKSFGESSKEQFDYFLLNEGLIEKENLLNALSEHYKVPSFDVSGYFFKTDLLHLFPKDFLLRNRIIPLEINSEGVITIIASNPGNDVLLERIAKYGSFAVEFMVGLGLGITDAIKEYYQESITEIEEEDVEEEE